MRNGSAVEQTSLEQDTRIAELLEVLRSEKRWAVIQALSDLLHLGLPSAPELQQQVIEALIAKLKGRGEEVGRYAAFVLGKLGLPATHGLYPQAIQALIENLEDRDERVRQSAVLTLGALGLPATHDLYPQVIQDLIAKLEDSESWARREAAQALGKLGLPSTAELQQQVIEALIAKLQDSEVWVRGNAAEALGKLGLSTTHDLYPKAIEALVAKLEDRSEPVRKNASEALGNLRLPATHDLYLKAIEALVAKLEDSSEWVRCEAAQALGRLGLPATHDLYPKVIQALIDKLEDSSEWVRDAASKALEKLRMPAADAAPVLPIVATDEDPGVEETKGDDEAPQSPATEAGPPYAFEEETKAEEDNAPAVTLVAIGNLEELANLLREEYQGKHQELYTQLEEVARQIQEGDQAKTATLEALDRKLKDEQRRCTHLQDELQEALASIEALKADHLQLEERLTEQYEQLQQKFLELQEKVYSVERETLDKKAEALSPERRAYYHSFVSMFNGFCTYAEVHSTGYVAQRIDNSCTRFVEMMGLLGDVLPALARVAITGVKEAINAREREKRRQVMKALDNIALAPGGRMEDTDLLARHIGIVLAEKTPDSEIAIGHAEAQHILAKLYSSASTVASIVAAGDSSDQAEVVVGAAAGVIGTTMAGGEQNLSEDELTLFRQFGREKVRTMVESLKTVPFGIIDHDRKVGLLVLLGFRIESAATDIFAQANQAYSRTMRMSSREWKFEESAIRKLTNVIIEQCAENYLGVVDELVVPGKKARMVAEMAGTILGEGPFTRNPKSVMQPTTWVDGVSINITDNLKDALRDKVQTYPTR